MRSACRVLLAAHCLLGAVPALGQSTQVQIPSPILTLDQEALFNGSQLAERISAEIERVGEKLAAENLAIETKLIAEELDLTEKRPKMDPVAFRALADAFDEKVQKIRDEQDAKARDFQRLRDREQQNFLRRITPILGEIVRDRGAVAVLDRRSVFLSAESIDITQEAIDRINAAFEDGTVILDPPVPDVIPEPVPAPEAPMPTPPADPLAQP